MNLTNRHLFACVLFGCTSQPSDDGATTAAPTGEGQTPSDDAPSADVPPEPPAVPLVRGLGHESSITEVWLDARASSALTLDFDGGVRLWPALPPAQTQLAALAPIRVPIREPLWLSLARAGERTFVVAAIDTAQSARVLEIQLDDAGTASFRTRFETPPRDPLFELHVLDGGERILALGVDHRIRLYDGRGQLLSELTEYGLAPWQLRLAGPPEALQLAMVLAGPTRLQRFTIQADKLAKHGEARTFTLDRGPNHNDLALLPSGRVAAVLRRPKPKGPQWSLELHDLDTGEVRVLWSEVEAKWRPRLHIIDDERALLEDGIAGYWIDLRQAVAMPAPFELPEELEDLPPESHVTVRRVPLPDTSQPERKHASIVAGVRVVPPGGILLTIDPIDSDRHYRMGHHHAAPFHLDFESGGDLLALAYPDKIIVESISTGVQHPVDVDVGYVQGMQFIDADHLLVLEPKQARVCAWRTGQEVAKLDLGEASVASVEIHPTGPGTGEFAMLLPGGDGVVHTTYTNKSFGALEPIDASELERWPEFGEWQAAAVDAAGNRYFSKGSNSRTLEVKLASGEKRKLEISDKGVEIQLIKPSPDGRSFALLTRPGVDHEEYGGYYGESYSYGVPEPPTLSVWTTSESTPEVPQLRWSTSTSTNLELTWTDDGSRLAYKEDRRLRIVTTDAEVLLDRITRDFHLTELPDDPSTTPSPSTP